MNYVSFWTLHISLPDWSNHNILLFLKTMLPEVYKNTKLTVLSLTTELIITPHPVNSDIDTVVHIKNWDVTTTSTGIRVCPTRPNMVRHIMGIPDAYTENIRCWGIGLISAKSLVMASCFRRMDSNSSNVCLSMISLSLALMPLYSFHIM